jgi:hypothetical protein
VTAAGTAVGRVLPPLSLRRYAAAWWLPAAVAVACLTWPLSTLSPAHLDAFWPVGLHMAAAQGLQPGTDVVFTYGPLGFLAFPLLVTTWTGIASFAFVGIAHLALVAVVLRAARRRLPWPAALVVAGMAGTAPVPPADIPVLLAFAGCIEALDDDEPTAGPAVVALAGALAAFEVLVKLNDGIVCLLLAALAAWRLGPRRLRAELLLVASFAVSLAALWRLAGSPLRDLPGWLRLGAHLLASYSQGMGLDGSAATLRTAAILLGAFLALAVAQARGLGRARGGALLAATLLFGFAFFKEGFVRADRAHTGVYFAVLAVAPLLVARSTTAVRAAGLLLAAMSLEQAGANHHLDAGVLVLVASWSVVRAVWPDRPLHGALAVAVGALLLVLAVPRSALPRPAAGRVLSQVRILANGERRAEQIAAAKAAVREQTVLAPNVLRALHGHTVDVEPFGATLAWAYGLDWHPEPLLESYAAYDPTLDRFAASALAGGGADRILRWNGLAIDGHDPSWEAPALVLAETCHYRPVASSGSFTVLARTANVCGTPRLVSSATAAAGSWVRVPAGAPGERVYASVHVRPRLQDSVRSLLLRPPALHIEIPGRRYGLVAATAADPLLMTNVRRFRLDRAARVDFYAVTLRPPS